MLQLEKTIYRSFQEMKQLFKIFSTQSRQKLSKLGTEGSSLTI